MKRSILCILICIFMVLAVITTTVAENVNTKTDVSKKKEKEDFFVDDEDLEGSGNGENRSDLESSGSGYGPDDEDTLRSLVPGGIDKKLEEKTPGTIPMPTTKLTTIQPPPKTERISETPIVIKTHKDPDETRVFDGKNDIGLVATEKPIDDIHQEDNSGTVYKDRTTSFFAQPGILAGYFIFPAIIGGAVVGLLCAILVVMFIVYRMRKKDEGSYALEELKRCPPTNPYLKPNHREFFA